jgi:hypothetical protein
MNRRARAAFALALWNPRQDTFGLQMPTCVTALNNLRKARSFNPVNAHPPANAAWFTFVACLVLGKPVPVRPRRNEADLPV